ncbi:RICIN domain-containing protein [Paenibacillus harenae]|uniref:RICIN domain-containing protein n=1 Tax=Paenibacillus harenae TaxID=306543 RepID=UPI0004915E34|nr:RICIN domain-containing protein [Paenibacillus harenae]
MIILSDCTLLDASLNAPHFRLKSLQIYPGFSCDDVIGLANGACKLIARHSGKAMDVDAASTADGASIQQWTDTGGSNQQWYLIKQ